jgi:flavorubredoxin
MDKIKDTKILKPVKIFENIFWIGYYYQKYNINNNTYLIKDGEESIIIDPDESNNPDEIIQKLKSIDIEPNSVKAFVFHNFFDDTYRRIESYRKFFQNKELKFITQKRNHNRASLYDISDSITDVEKCYFKYTFSSERELQFIRTPYSPYPDSFVTYDETSSILFSGEMFCSKVDESFNLLLTYPDECDTCSANNGCNLNRIHCDIFHMINHHVKMISSENALKDTMNNLTSFRLDMIAPKQGGILFKEKDIRIVINTLRNLKGVGIDGFHSV